MNGKSSPSECHKLSLCLFRNGNSVGYDLNSLASLQNCERCKKGGRNDEDRERERKAYFYFTKKDFASALKEVIPCLHTKI
jgi:hypothetical protein